MSDSRTPSDAPDPILVDSDDADLVPRDKLFEHHRRQLSAMLDGELPPDQAKFMLRRLQHDGELAACWERWQVCGDMLRGRHDVLLPADFSQRVTAAIAAGDTGGVDAAAAPAGVAASPTGAQSSQRWLRWGGGALAASVALVAMMFARAPTAPGLVDPAGDAASTQVTSVVTAGSAASNVAVSKTTPDDALATRTEALAPPAPPPDGVPDRNAGLATAAAVAVATVPRRVADRDRRSTRSQSQRAGVRLRSADSPMPQLASATSTGAAAPDGDVRAAAAVRDVAASGTALDPFVTGPAAPTRPWPRAILPGYATGGAFNASFGGTETGSFHPFEPTSAAPVAPPQDPAPAARGPR